jgi:hypothetical protein
MVIMQMVEHAVRNVKTILFKENIMKLLLAFLLSMVLSTAQAEKPELEGGDVVRQALCTHGKQKVLCVAVKKDDKLYVVVIDEKGELSITWIAPKGNVMVWSRDSI